MGKEKGVWNIIPYKGLIPGVQKSIPMIFRIAWLRADNTVSPTAKAIADGEESSDSEDSESSEENQEDEEDEEDAPKWSDDESNSSESPDNTDDEDTVGAEPETDTEPETEGEDDGPRAINCLVLAPEIGDLYWTKSWTETSNALKRIIPAVHTSLPLVVFTTKPFQLEVVDLNERAQATENLPGPPPLVYSR
jgi:hypothetical protein